MIDGEATYLRPTGRLDCTDGQVLHAWCSDGLGVAWRSAWEVQQEVAAGALVSVLDAFAAPPNVKRLSDAAPKHDSRADVSGVG